MSSLKAELCRYRYDALDRIVGCMPAGEETTQRFYCREHLVTKLDGQASHSVFLSSTQLLAQVRREGADSQSSLLATDQQRSVLQINQADRPVPQAFAPYGHHRRENGLGSLMGFNGEVIDPVTGHYLLGNGHRAFNPVLMRFNSPDSLSPFGRGGLNPYAYCLGDPVNFSDPTGRVTRLITSLFSLGNSRIVLSPSIPYQLAKDALQWGAAGQLPLKYTVGALGSTTAGVTTVLAALTGIGAAVAAINKDTEAAAVFGFITLGLGAMTLSARMGSFWAARDTKTIPALKQFVENKGRANTVSPRSPSPSMAPMDVAPSAPPLSPGFFEPSAPSLNPGAGTSFFSGQAYKRKHDGTLIYRRRHLTARRKNIRESTDL
ncbi:RHS repeat-associated core domain-containing protein [Pseudomonas sp. NFX224]|uniref:RHS repeat-associated core domain-containing protein n=1 Tax=Pseudomonas sp. NFX224 TaxID=3402862 RepID=UPI003AFAA9E9